MRKNLSFSTFTARPLLLGIKFSKFSVSISEVFLRFAKISNFLAVKLQHFEFFKFGILKVLMVENIITVNTKKIQIQKP